MQRHVLLVLLLLLALFASATTNSAPKVADPLQLGSYPVGVSTTVFVDHRRTEVKGERAYLPFLLKNHWPDELQWETKGVGGKQATSR